MSKKVVISAALTGAATMKEQNPAVPFTHQRSLQSKAISA
jgi:uncharacterized protein (DUF849 family)